jgi:hypothetical protein
LKATLQDHLKHLPDYERQLNERNYPVEVILETLKPIQEIWLLYLKKLERLERRRANLIEGIVHL